MYTPIIGGAKCIVDPPTKILEGPPRQRPPWLTLQRHVNKVASLCFHHIHRLKQVCKLLGPGVATTLVSAFVLSRLDYCTAILAGLPKTTIAPLQRAQNAAARLVAQLGPRDHISNALRAAARTAKDHVQALLTHASRP